MCTVVCRWNPDDPWPVLLLALRDERRDRDFDLPGAWWPDQPQVVGGRDRQAGGSWCVSDVASGVTAVVLNRPEKREATAGAPSRGLLPLTAVAGADWPERLTVPGMASFNLALVEPDALRWWSFDGVTLTSFALPPGTYLFKPTGLITHDVDPALLGARAQLAEPTAPTEAVWADWLARLRAAEVTDDGTSLLIERTLDDGNLYETVFGQFIAAGPGHLRLDYLRRPAHGGAWTTRTWPAAKQITLLP